VKGAKLQVVAPIWAKQIAVERQDGSLLVTGWGCVRNPLDAEAVGAGRASQLDILQRLRRYVLDHLSKEKPEGGGVYQLADATNDEKLISFVAAFGPVWGEVRSSSYEHGTWTLIVSQELEKLREEQKKFSATVKLLQQMNLPVKASRLAMMRAMNDLGIDAGTLGILYGITESLPSLVGHSEREKRNYVLDSAHVLLCEVLNEYPPKLAPFKGEAIELPDTRDEGIRNTLYYLLRRDYLAQREIGTCLHCGSHFSVTKRGMRGCSFSCRRALTNRKQWDKSKDCINAERRKKYKGRM